MPTNYKCRLAGAEDKGTEENRNNVKCLTVWKLFTAWKQHFVLQQPLSVSLYCSKLSDRWMQTWSWCIRVKLHYICCAYLRQHSKHFGRIPIRIEYFFPFLLFIHIPTTHTQHITHTHTQHISHTHIYQAKLRETSPIFMSSSCLPF